MTNFKSSFWKVFLLVFISIISVSSFSQKCIDLGVGITLSNGEYAFIDFCKNGNRWEVNDAVDDHPWYKVYSMDEYKIINGAYWTWDADWSGTINNEAWGDDWADTYHDFYQMSIEQGAFDAQGWPLQVPYTLYKYFPKSIDPNQGLDMTQPVQINEITRRYYFPDGLPQDGWILKWEGTGSFEWQGLEIMNIDQGTAVEGGNSWTTDGSYAGRDVTFTSTGQGRIECRHFYMVHGWVLNITSSDVSDPIRNIEFIYPGLESNHDAGEVFHPQFIERMKQFKVLRYMGYLSSNDLEKRTRMATSHPYFNSHYLKYMEWNERIPGDWYRVNDGSGGAYEYIIELSNLTKTDPWINIPYCAGPDYADSITRFFLERLDPDLTLYIEIANELWNFGSGFMGFHWVASNKDLRYPGLGDVESRGAHLNTIFERVTEVAGTKGLERIERVYGAWPRYTDVNNRTLNYLDEENWDCLATTWYFGLNDDNSSGNPCLDPVSTTNWRSVLYNWWNANQGDQVGFNAKYKECILEEFRCRGGYRDNSDVVLSNYYNKYVVCYEGGNHTFYGCENGPTGDALPGELNFDADANYPDYITDNEFIASVCMADESQEIADVYDEIIDSLQSAGVKVANHLSFAGRSSCYGVWSFIQPKDMDEDLATLFTTYPKFKLYSDRIAADNCNAVYVDLDTNLVGPGLCVMMDGLNDYVEGPSSGIPDESLDYTMETWFKIRHLDIEQVVIELMNDGVNNNYNVVKARTDKKIVWEIGNNSTQYAKLVGDELIENKWYHIALTKSSNRYTMYLNGINVASGNFTIPVLTRNHFCIGAAYNPPFGNDNLGGEIDEVRMWNTALTQNDIRDYMCKKVAPSHANYANLVTYYRFDRPDKVNFEVYDVRTGVNSGQLYNINFTSRSRYALSGAPLGDLSRFVYAFDWSGVGVTLNHPEGDMVAVSNIGSGSPDGIHIYITDEAAYYNDPPQYYEGITNNRYFGVYIANGTEPTYDVTYVYEGNPQSKTGTEENKHRLLRRDNASEEFWVHSGARLDETANTLSLACKEVASGEYVMAFRQSNSIQYPGPGDGIRVIEDEEGINGGFVRYLDLSDYTVSVWTKGWGEVFNFTRKFDGGEERFSVSGSWPANEEVSASFRFSTAYEAQGFDFGSSPLVARSDEWTHWAIVRDGTLITVYANGRQVVSKNFIGTNKIEEMYVCDPPSYASNTNISIDELTVWDVALDVETIRDWMCKKINSDHPYECENLVLYFNFNEGQGTVLEDRNGQSDMLLNPNVQYITSGAAIGDESVHDYVTPDNLSFAHPNGDYFEVTKTNSIPVYGIQLYRVDFAVPDPSLIQGTSINSIDSSRYWGMFITHEDNEYPEYDVVNHFAGNSMINPGRESELRLLSRTNHEDADWANNDAILPNLGNSTLTLTGETVGEYMLGGTTTSTFIGDCSPSTPVFVAEAGTINQSTICGNAVGLTYRVTPDPLVELYLWTLPNGLSGFSTADSITVNAELGYESPPDFTISVVAVNSCGESSSSTYDITINPSPTLSDAGPDQLLLPPITSAVMDGNSVSGGETGTWTVGLQGGGTIVGINDPLTTINALPTGTNYFAWTIDNGVCQPSTDTVEIIVAPPPQDIIDPVNGSLPADVCEGSLYTFEAVPPEDIIPDGYLWELPDGLSIFSQSGNQVTIQVGQGIGGTIKVSAVYAGSPSDQIESTVISIRSLPVKPTFVQAYDTVCLDGIYTYEALMHGSIDNYEWTYPAGIYTTVFPKSTSAIIDLEITDSVSGYIKVQAYNGLCTSPASADSIEFFVYNAPTPPELPDIYRWAGLWTNCKYDLDLLWVKDNDPAAIYEWEFPSYVRADYIKDNFSAAIVDFSDGHFDDIIVRKIVGTGFCNTSAPLVMTMWSQADRFASPTDPIVLTDPPAQDPMDLQVGQEYTFQSGGGADGMYWILPVGVEEVWDNTPNDDYMTIRVLSEFTGYIEGYALSPEGCIDNLQRMALCSNPIGNCLLPPEWVSGDTAICQGTNLHEEVVNIAGATEYVWTFPNGDSTITPTNILDYIVNDFMIGDVSVIARNANGQSQPATFPIRILANPMRPIEFVDEDNNVLNFIPICTTDGNKPIFIRDIGASDYTWDINNTIIFWRPEDPANGYRQDPKTTGTDTVNFVQFVEWRYTQDPNPGYLEVTATNGCGAPVFGSVMYDLVIPPNDQVPNFVDAPTSVCMGSNVTYRIDPIENADSYIWTVPSGFVATELITYIPEITVDIMAGIGGVVTVYATSSVCGGGNSMTQSTDNITIAGAPVDFDFNLAPLAGCPGDFLTYEVNDAGVPDYTWTIPDGLSPILTGTTIVIDNGDPECTQFGNWTTTLDAVYLNGDYITQGNCLTVCDDGANDYDTYVLFTPNIPIAGKYKVYFNYPPYPVQTENLRFYVDVNDINGITTTQLIYSSPAYPLIGPQSALLGTYDFELGTSGFVRMNTIGSHGYRPVRADNVRFELSEEFITIDSTLTFEVVGGGNGSLCVTIEDPQCASGYTVCTDPINLGGNMDDPIFESQETSLCIGSSYEFQVSNIGADTYTWMLPTGLSISSQAGEVTDQERTVMIDVDSDPGTQVQIGVFGVINSCGVESDTVYSALIDVADCKLATPVFVLEEDTVCVGSTATLNIGAVPSAEEYVWTLPVGVEESVTQDIGVVTTDVPTITITVLSAGNLGDISVIATAPIAGIEASDPAITTNPIVAISPPAFVTTTTNLTSCLVPDGSIELTGLSPVSTYQVSYFDGSTTQGPTAYISDFTGIITLPGLLAGTYSDIDVSQGTCNTIDNGNYTINPVSAATISSVSFSSPAICGETGTITVSLNGATDGDSYEIDLNNDAVVEDTLIVTSGDLVLSGINNSLTVTGIAVTNIVTYCSDISADNGTITMLDTAQIDTIIFTQPASCGGTGSIAIYLTGAGDGEIFDIDYNNDLVVDNVGTVSGGIITLTGIYAGVIVSDLLITNQTTNCPSSSAIIGSVYDPTTVVISAVSFTHPATCGGLGSIEIYLTGATDGEFYDVDFNGDDIIEYTEAVNSSMITIPNLLAGVEVNALVITNAISDCKTTSLETDTIEDPDLPNVTLAPFNNMCEGDAVTTLVGGLPTLGIYSGPGVSMGEFNPVTAGVGTHTITYEYTNANNCSNYATETITVNALPAGTLTSNAANDRICEGDAITFTATDGTDFTFIINGIPEIPSIDNTFTPTSLNDQDTVSVSVMRNACVSVYPGIVVTIDTLPTGTLVSDNPYNSICSGDLITFTATGGISYNFMVNGQSTYIAGSVYSTNSLEEDDIVSVEVTDGNNCSSIIDSTITVKVRPNPVIGILDGLSEVCPGEKEVVYRLLSYLYGHTYEWSITGEDTSVYITDIARFVNWGIDNEEGIVAVKVIEDETGCYTKDSVIVSISDNTLPSLAAFCNKDFAPVEAELDSTVAYYKIDSSNIDFIPNVTNIVDNCLHTGYTLNYTIDGDNSIYPESEFIGQVLYDKINTVTWIVQDNGGNEDECTFEIIMDIDERPPSAFSPNGDGVNDSWEIKYLNLYDNCHVKVFNRRGKLVFENKGYTKKWDGTFSGKVLPVDSYHYVIIRYEGAKPQKGTVTIIK